MVIAIIAILVSLTASGVMNIMLKIPEVQTRTEIGEMETALNAMMSDFKLSTPPPSSLLLQSNVANYAAGDPSLAFLKKMFGKNLGALGAINWGGTDGTTLTGEQCLVFYLGGINNGQGLSGFSYNTMNPYPVPGSGQRTHGPYFTFKTNRLVPGPNGFLVYIDAWQSKTSPTAALGGSPYTYFSSQGITNNPLYGLNPYTNTTSSGYGAVPYVNTVNSQFTNPNTFQIISAGRNGMFGTSGWNPANGATGAGADDQANFSAKVLGAGQQ